jgi:hypothetical protein
MEEEKKVDVEGNLERGKLLLPDLFLSQPSFL